ncbi:MAG: formylglycine-generating enzyme family protein, partial [Opitutaceae bacterium]|nr:formylglycine-generating enzyme family protein [Opitutaceae bacterium]
MNTTKSTGTAALLATLAMTAATACGAISVTIETVTIGNPGNNGDTVTMVTDGGSTGYGAVSYTYEIGTKEVTSGQYAAFLNAVAATDTYGLYNEFMDRTLHSGDYGCGITRSGAPGSYEYAVTEEYKDKPVNYVSVYDAMRYTNWLTNGQQNDATTTEYGVYLL